MSETGPYGTTQHTGREGPVTANQLVGERAGSASGNAVIPGAGPALHSTAPYKRPKPKPPHAGPKGCWGNDGTCGAPAVRGSQYCFFHKG
jgi:hypothetical protein